MPDGSAFQLREWFTIGEIAAARRTLPDLDGLFRGRAERNIREAARREGWEARPAKRRGGGSEYHHGRMHHALAAALLVPQQAAKESAQPAERSQTPDSAALWAHFDALPETQKDEARRRLTALDTVRRLVGEGKGKTAAIDAVGLQVGASRRTLQGWFDLVAGLDRVDWLPALAPRYAGGQRQADCSPEAWEHFVADYLRNSEPAGEACYRRLQRVAQEQGWTIPSLKTLLRRVEREIPRNVQILLRKGEHDLTRAYPSQRRDHSVFAACEAVTADGHRFDVFVNWGGRGETSTRAILLAIQDIYSGKILSWRLAPEPTAELVRLTLVDLVTDWGVPRVAWLDNDRIFASKWITGGQKNRFRFKIKDTDPDGVLTTLDVKVHWTTPYWGQAKPIERAFRDLCEDIAKHPLCEGAYTGNSPVTKPANYGSKALPIAEFEALVAQQIAEHNARPGRRSAVCGGIKSFDDVFLASWTTSAPRRITAEQRRMMLMAAEGVTANRQNGGRIELFGNLYWHERLLQFAGKRLVVRFDPEALDQAIHVYTLDGRYLCDAECQALVGFEDTAAAKAHARARRDFIRATKARATALVKLDALDPTLRIAVPDQAEPPAPAAITLVPTRRKRAVGAEQCAPDEPGISAEVAAQYLRRGLSLVPRD